MTFAIILRGTRDFIVGSLRLVLFLACCFVLIIQVADSYLSIKLLQRNFKVGTLGVDGGDFLRILYLSGLALLGCFATFYKNKEMHKLFTVLVVITFMVLAVSYLKEENPYELEKSADKTMDELRDHMKSYYWGYSSFTSNTATRSWDSVQSFHCCGVKGPEDWNKFRPEEVSNNLYPQSCCRGEQDLFELPTKFCDINDKGLLKVYSTGCSERLQEVYINAKETSRQYLVLASCICSISLLIQFMRSKKQSMVDVERNGVGQAQYQRFGTGVYMHQPASSPNLEYKSSLYPNINPTAPPTYGSSR